MEKPTKEQAQQAVKLLLSYIGEDADREGLRDTPKRVVKSYAELFSGYNIKIEDVLDKKFYDIKKYNDAILLKTINFTSLCEHHMLPFFGTVDIAYIPNGAVLGISKIARLVDVFAKRLQIQEKMTTEIANALQDHLKPAGVAIRISAKHICMTSRGAYSDSAIFESSHFTGVYKEQPEKRAEFWHAIRR